MPRIHIRKHLAFDKKEVATPNKIVEWDYLKTISSEITRTDDVEAGLLIGVNCMKALEPLKVIASNNGEHYAYQICLGWCIVGPISNMFSQNVVGCHRIAVQDAISSKIVDHQFVVEEFMKKISLEEMFQKMHQNNFVEKEVISVNGLLENMVEISKEKAFLKIVEESTIKSVDHSVVPLPFKKENLIMPNNRKQAMQRLIYLKRRFNKDPAFFEDYKQLMSNLLVKGYARKLDDSSVGRTWYIPHHGVHHLSKSRKIRVVFDCSAQFAGKSLNQELLTVPDLTNQIVGVLTRFRQGEVAFMADIESMYYQVRVPEYQQTFIKFLWWENHNIEEEPSDFAMCAHVFGGVLSASCSN